MPLDSAENIIGKQDVRSRDDSSELKQKEQTDASNTFLQDNHPLGKDRAAGTATSSVVHSVVESAKQSVPSSLPPFELIEDRLKHAIEINQYGHAKNDHGSKDLSVEVVKSIATLSPEIFNNSADIQGLIGQARRGKVMDLTDQKAASVAYIEAAVKTLGQDFFMTDYSKERSIHQITLALMLNEKEAYQHWNSVPELKKHQDIFDRAATRALEIRNRAKHSLK